MRRHHSQPRTPQIGADRAQFGGDRGGAGNDIEQNVPLRAEDHQRAEPNIRIEFPGDDDRHEDREQKISRKGGQELRYGLNQICSARPRADPNADRHPDDARDRDQHDNAGERRQAQQHRDTHVGERDAFDGKAYDLP